MRYKISDEVKWDVPSRTDIFGDIRHVGTVVGVVAAGNSPYTEPMEEPYHSMRMPSNLSRNHESYIVHVPGPGKGRLYWPRVSGLRKVTP
jgi:hypothetical protein